MSFYLILLLLTLCVAFLTSKMRGLVCQSIGKAIVFFVLTAPAAVRYDIGYDYTPVYCVAFDQIAKGADIGDWWSGAFKWMVELVVSNELDYQWIFAVISVVTYLPVVIAGRAKHLHAFIFVYFIVFYFFTYNGIRQGVALSFGILGIRKLLTHKFLSGCLIASMGALFHTSSIFFLPLFIFVFFARRFSDRQLLVAGCVLSVMGVLPGFGNLIFSSIECLPGLSWFSHNYAGHGIYDAAPDRSGFGTVFWAIIYGAAAVLLMKFKRAHWHRDAAILSIVAFAVTLSTSRILIFDRVAIMTDCCLPFVMEGIVEVSRNRRFRLLPILLCALMLFYFCYHYTRVATDGMPPHATIPYRSIFEGDWR